MPDYSVKRVFNGEIFQKYWYTRILNKDVQGTTYETILPYTLSIYFVFNF